ncbi:hypothetical protein CFP65_3927 [Kitasatospora sp. MMS16-BH015]|uniref:RNA-binding protein n=1 Tax=Kitasatospora sp. MMS16-BH015 TaxID=2018025 RepID=UPI000CA3EEED|nr:RNA-binding protein [Kitasatospora sp. MMS16-BH015]AUG78700.1 hypothetical protein CFP65_3927 [Kitasatospora sp. MMS16-BH015]
MTDTAEWEAAKRDFPIGHPVTGRIAAVRPFGMFVALPGRPEVIAVLDAISYHPDQDPIPPEQWPGVGEEIGAVVSSHAEHNHQIKLRVG